MDGFSIMYVCVVTFFFLVMSAWAIVAMLREARMFRRMGK